MPGAADDVSITGTLAEAISNADAAHSLTIADAKANVIDNGSLALGGTLSITAGTFTLASSGTLSGGIVADTGGSFIGGGGTLSAVTIQGVLGLTQSSASFTIVNGITLQGAGGSGSGSITLTGQAAALYVQGNTTLNNATITIGETVNYGAYGLQESDAGSTAGTLVLGAKLNLTQATAGVTYGYLSDAGNAGDAVVNQGTITAADKSGLFTIGGNSFTNAGTMIVANGDDLNMGGLANFTNAGRLSAAGTGTRLNIDATNWTSTGTLSVGTGAALNLGGTFSLAALSTVANSGGSIGITGDLINSGGTLAVGTGTGFGVASLAGTITGGTVADSGGGIVAAGGTLSGVAYQGALTIGAQLYIDATDSFAGTGGTGGGTIDISGNSELFYTGSGTVDNVTINLGGSSGRRLF